MTGYEITMTLKILSKKKLILTNSNQEIVFNQPIQFIEGSIKIGIIIDSLLTLQDFEISSPDVFFKIKKDLDVKKGLRAYKSSEGLSLYVYEDSQYLAILSAGEFQPSLYKVFLEVLYEKKA